MSEREKHLRDAYTAARKAEKWANVSVWGSGCALAAYGLVVVLALAVAVWVALAVR